MVIILGVSLVKNTHLLQFCRGYAPVLHHRVQITAELFAVHDVKIIIRLRKTDTGNKINTGRTHLSTVEIQFHQTVPGFTTIKRSIVSPFDNFNSLHIQRIHKTPIVLHQTSHKRIDAADLLDRHPGNDHKWRSIQIDRIQSRNHDIAAVPNKTAV